MKKLFCTFILIVLALLTTSCSQTKEDTSNSNNQPTKSDFVASAETPKLFSPLRRGDFNTTLNNFIKKEYPNSTIHGVANQLKAGNMYLIDVDLSSPTKSEVVHVVARFFVSLNGDDYWKIERPTHELQYEMEWIKQVEVGNRNPDDDK